MSTLNNEPQVMANKKSVTLCLSQIECEKVFSASSGLETIPSIFFNDNLKSISKSF